MLSLWNSIFHTKYFELILYRRSLYSFLVPFVMMKKKHCYVDCQAIMVTIMIIQYTHEDFEMILLLFYAL